MSGWGDLMQRIGQDGSKWQCTGCLTFSPNSLTECPCCEAPRPGGGAAPAAPASSAAVSASSLFSSAPAPSAASLFSTAPSATPSAAALFGQSGAGKQIASSQPAAFSFGAPAAQAALHPAPPKFGFFVAGGEPSGTPSAAAAAAAPAPPPSNPFNFAPAASTPAQFAFGTASALPSSFSFGTPAPPVPTAPPHPVLPFGFPAPASTARPLAPAAPAPALSSPGLSASMLRMPAGSVRAAISSLLPGAPATCTVCLTVFLDAAPFCPACHAPHTRRVDTAPLPVQPVAAAAAGAFLSASNAASKMFASSVKPAAAPDVAPFNFSAPATAASFVSAPVPASSSTPVFSFGLPAQAAAAAAATPAAVATASSSMPALPISGASSSAAASAATATAVTADAKAVTAQPPPQASASSGSMARDVFPPFRAYESPEASLGVLMPSITAGVGDYELAALPLGGGASSHAAIEASRGGKKSKVVAAASAAPRWSVFTCGSGECEQLGHGGDPDREDDLYSMDKPTLLRALARVHIARIAVGGLHSLLVATDGSLWSFGCNDDCALGREGAENRPGRVRGLLNDVPVIAVSAGDSHSVALDAQGRVYAWGTYKGADGYLGFDAAGKERKASSPRSFADLTTRFGAVVAISSGADHTGALTASGRAVVWGYGGQGQLGRKVAQKGDAGASDADVLAQLHPMSLPIPRGAGPFAPRVSPPFMPLPGAESSVPQVLPAAALAAPQEQPPTRKGSRAPRGSAAAAAAPPALPAAKGGAKRKRGAASAEEDEAVAAATPLPMDEQPLGRLWCVGYCTFLQTRPDGTGAGGGLIYACGLNSYGQLGLGDTDDRTVPALVSSLSAPCAPGGGIVAICGGSQHSLALTRDGGVFSWGRGDSGQLGLVASADARGRLPMACGAFTPRQLPPSAFSRAPIVALAANGCSSCALTADGTLFSWGFGESGQLAHGRSADENVPRAVNASASTIITAAAAVGLGGQHIVILAEPRAGLTSKDLAAKECRVIEDPEVPVDDDEDDAGCGDDGRA